MLQAFRTTALARRADANSPASTARGAAPTSAAVRNAYADEAPPALCLSPLCTKEDSKKGGDGKYSKQRQSPPVRIQGQRIAKGYCGAALSVLLRKLVADMRQAAPFPH